MPSQELMHHKILRAMAQRKQEHRIDGPVQFGDACLGGERSGFSTGRGPTRKPRFVAAVSPSEAGHSLDVKHTSVSAFARDVIGCRACRRLELGWVVVSDGAACFAGVSSARCLRMPIVVVRAKPKELPELAWRNTVLGSLGSTIAGAQHSFEFSTYIDSCPSYLAFRFRYRFDLIALRANLIVGMVRCTPRFVRAIRQAEDHCWSVRS